MIVHVTELQELFKKKLNKEWHWRILGRWQSRKHQESAHLDKNCNGRIYLIKLLWKYRVYWRLRWWIAFNFCQFSALSTIAATHPPLIQGQAAVHMFLEQLVQLCESEWTKGPWPTNIRDLGSHYWLLLLITRVQRGGWPLLYLPVLLQAPLPPAEVEFQGI